jgi:hypothetical protein
MRTNKNLADLHKIIQINTEDFYDALTLFAELPTELHEQGISFVEHWLCGLKIELGQFKREVLQIDQSGRNNIHEPDQKQLIRVPLNELKRESSILWANLFTELPPHREKELLSHRDKYYENLEQIEKYIANSSGDDHAQK